MTNRRREWLLVLLGAWIAGSICTSVVATENFYTIDRLLAARSNAAFAAAVDRLGAPEARDLLRYLSSELNRLYFQLWNLAQIVIGGAALWLTFELRKQDAAYKKPFLAVALMLSIVALMLGYLTPQIVTLGRSLDFVPRDPAPAAMSRFWILHGTYTSLEVLKLIVGAIVTVSMIQRTSPARLTSS